MADWAKPVLGDPYDNFRQYFDDRHNDSARGLDPAITTVTNQPAYSIRWTSAGNKWQRYVSGVWSDLSSNYAINISGNAASASTASVAPWSGISGKPTTISGYGITDGITTGGGQTINGNLTLAAGDLWAYRAGGSTGVVYLTNSGTKYLYYDGSNYNMPGGELIVNGYQLARLASPAFTGTPTVPDAAQGTNTTQAANTKFVQSSGLGTVGQTYQNMNSSRSFGSTYTNGTGRPITVMLSISVSAGYRTGIKVDGVVAVKPVGCSTNANLFFEVVVPAGSTYQTYTDGSPATIDQWTELR